MRTVVGVVSVTGCAVAIAIVSLTAQARQTGGGRAAAKPHTTWQSYAGGAAFLAVLRARPDQPQERGTAPVAWSFPITGTSIFNPIVVDGVMYASVGGGALAAIDAATGKEIWRKDSMAPSGARGMNYWESPDRSDRRFIYLQRGDVIAVNAQNGEPITSFGNNGRVDLRDAMERKPPGPVGTSNPGPHLREPVHPPAAGRCELRRTAVGRPRLRRAHRQARLDLPRHSARRGIRLRHLARGTLAVRRRRTQLERVHRR